MDQNLRDEVFKTIAELVTFGFHPSKEKLLEAVKDIFYGEELDPKLIEKELDRVVATKLEEEKGWESITDFERLDACFSELRENGIVAVHHAGFTQSDGYEDSCNICEQWEMNGIIADGYCFYISQDTEGAINGRGLYLAFGAFDQQEKTGVKIGQKIVDVLKKHGFAVNWNNSIKTRIVIQPFVWRKRFGLEPCCD